MIRQYASATAALETVIKDGIIVATLLFEPIQNAHYSAPRRLCPASMARPSGLADQLGHRHLQPRPVSITERSGPQEASAPSAKSLGLLHAGSCQNTNHPLRSVSAKSMTALCWTTTGGPMRLPSE